MRISKPWIEFENAMKTAPKDIKEEILYSAALKKQTEIELEEDVELESDFPKQLVMMAMRKSSPIDQIKYIKRFSYELA